MYENLAGNSTTEVTIPKARWFYGFQIAVENIHSETYSLLIDNYVKDTEEIAHLLNAIGPYNVVDATTPQCCQPIRMDGNDLSSRKN